MKKQFLILTLLVTSLAGCDNLPPEIGDNLSPEIGDNLSTEIFDYKKALASVATEFAIIGKIDQTIYADKNQSILLQESTAYISQYTNVNWGEQEYYCHEAGTMDYQGTSYHFVGDERGYASQISLLPDNTVGSVSTGYDFATTFTALDFLLSDDVGYEMIDKNTLKLILGAGSEASTSLFFALTGYDGLGDVGKAYITFNDDGTLKDISFETTNVNAYCFVNKYIGQFTTRAAMPDIDKEILPVEATLTEKQAATLKNAFDAINGMNYTLNIVDGLIDTNYQYTGEYYCDYEIGVSNKGMVYTDLINNDSDYYLNVENKGLYGVRVDESTSPVTLTTTSENPLNFLETFLVKVGFSTDLFTFKGKDTYHLDTLLDFAPTYLVPSSPFYNASLWVNAEYGIDVTVKTGLLNQVEEVIFYTRYKDGSNGMCAVTCSVTNLGSTQYPYSNFDLEYYVQPTSWEEYEIEWGEPYMDDARAYFPEFEKIIPFYYSPSVNFSVQEDEYIAIIYLASSYEQLNQLQEALISLWQNNGWVFTMVDDNIYSYKGVHAQSGATCDLTIDNYIAYGVGAFVNFTVYAPSVE